METAAITANGSSPAVAQAISSRGSATFCALDGGPEAGPAKAVPSGVADLRRKLQEAERTKPGDLLRNQLRYGGFRDSTDLIELITLPSEAGKTSFHAFTTSHDEAVRLASSLTTERFGRLHDIDYSGVFLVPNKHVPGFEAKHEHGKWLPNNGATRNEDIVERRSFYLDLDTIRSAGINGVSATKAELRTTLLAGFDKLVEFKEVLGSDHALGFKMSGNGVQIDFRLADLPATDELDGKLKRLLHVWAELFDTDNYKIDTSVHDAKRIGPVAGTRKKKGADYRPEGREDEWRPHRTVLFFGPDEVEPLTNDQLDDLIGHYDAQLTLEQRDRIDAKLKHNDPKKPTARTSTSTTPSTGTRRVTGPFDLANMIPIREVYARVGQDPNNPTCLDPACRANDTTAFLDDKLGVQSLKCQHATCKRKSWKNIDIVVVHQLGRSPDDQAARLEAVNWLSANFPEADIPKVSESRRDRIERMKGEVDGKLGENPNYLDDRISVCTPDTPEEVLRYLVLEIDTRSPVQQARYLRDLAKKTKLGVSVLRKAGQDHYEQDDVADGNPADTYPIVDGCLCRAVQTDAGVRNTKLSNFNATITDVIITDDGVEKTRAFQVEGTTANGTALPAVRIPAADFEDMKWVGSQWAPAAIVEPGRSTKDALRAAIEVHSAGARQTQVFGHTGWRKVDGSWLYLHGGGAIGGSDATVELTGKLAAFTFDATAATAADLRQAIHQSYKIMAVAPDEVSIPLFCLTYTAPLGSLLRPKFSTWLIGESEAMKSSVALELQRHFGGGFVDTLSFVTNFTSTATAIEGTLFASQDVLVVVDDFCPKNSNKDADKQRGVAEIITRNIGNGSTRERSRANLEAQVSRPPRAIVLCTAEEDPFPPGSASSLSNRMLKLYLRKGDVRTDVLSDLQGCGDQLQLAMSSYIEWLAQRHEDLRASVPSRYREVVQQVRSVGGLRARQPDIVASLYVAFELHSQFAVAAEVLTDEQAKEKCNEVKDMLLAVAAEQAQQDDTRKPEVRYLEAIKTLLTSGRCKLEDAKTALSSSTTCPGIGWYDESYVYLERAVTHSNVMRLLAETREPMAAGVNELHQSMVNRGWVIPPTEKGRIAGKESLGGSRPRVIKLPVTVFEDVHIDGLYELLHEDEIRAKQEQYEREVTAALNEAMEPTSGNVEDVSV